MAGPLQIDVFRGVNLLRDARRIADDELVMARNVIPVRPGRIGKRPGALVVDLDYLQGSFGGVPPTQYPISGIVSRYLPSIKAMVAVRTQSSTRLLRVPQDAAADGGFFDFGVQCQKPFFLNASIAGVNLVLCFPGYPYRNTGVKLVDNGSSVAATPINFDNTQPSRVPQGACAYRSRTVFWNFGPGFESYLVFSDNFVPMQITSPSGGVTDPLAANGRAFLIGSASDGDKIVACVQVMLTAVGDPAASGLLVLKEKSAYLITGEPNQTTDGGAVPFLNNIDVKRISYNCGCAAPETIAQTPYGIFWAGPDDVWFFQIGAGTPLRVGTKIRPALQRTAPSMRYKWSAAYFNGFYRLCVAGEGQSMGQNDPLQDQWWLDLRDGPPIGEESEPQEQASWWGPQQYQSWVVNMWSYGIAPGFSLIAGAPAGSMRTSNWQGTMFRPVQVGDYVEIQNAGNAQNNGSFPVTGIVDAFNGVYDVGNPNAIVPDPSNASSVGGLGGTVIQGCYMLLLDDRIGADPALYSVTFGSTIVTMFGQGVAPVVILQQMDAGGPRDISYDTFGTVGIYSGLVYPDPSVVQGTEIQMELRTKNFDFNAPSLVKLFEGLLADVWAENSNALQVDVWMNGGKVVDQVSRYVAEDGFVLDLQALDAIAASDVPQGIAVRPSPNTRDLGITIQFRIYDTPGFWVGSDNSSFIFIYGSTQYVASIPLGFYASIAALGAAVAAAMNVAQGGTPFTFDFSQGATPGPTFTSSGSTWRPDVVGAGQSAATLAASKKLLTQLGFDPNGSYSNGAAQWGASVYPQTTSIWEFASFIFEYDVFPREPT